MQRVSIYLLSHTRTASSTIHLQPQRGTFTATEKSLAGDTQTHCLPKCTVYMSVQSSCCVFYGFRQMYDDRYPPLQYHTELFHCPKNALSSTYPSLFPCQPLETTDLLTVSIVFSLPECCILESYSICCLFRLTSFTYQYAFKVPPGLFMA